MIYEVDFTLQSDEHFVSIQTAFIYALNVTECRDIANEMAAEIEVSEDNLQVYIEELFIQ